jgi:excisionase family DNA binding protein
MAPRSKPLTVSETADALETSLSTVWRLLRAGALRSSQSGGRRWVNRADVERRSRQKAPRPRPLSANHPFLRMVGAYKSGGRGPGSENKYAALFPR